MTLSQALKQAAEDEYRGLVFRDKDRNETRILIGFGQLWVRAADTDVPVPYSPTIREAIEDGWEPTNDHL